MNNKIFFSVQSFMLLALIFSTNIFADSTQLQKVTLEELSWMDKNKIYQQEEAVNTLAKSKLGLSLHTNWDDIALLQQLTDRKLVASDDSALQEAMGVVLGNIMQADFPSHLEWKVYKDSLGRSKALCIKNTKDCLFPVTMLSRRMRLGMSINITEIYDNAIDQVAGKLPKMPYGDDLLHQLKR
jgi:hypothetical protein